MRLRQVAHKSFFILCTFLHTFCTLVFLEKGKQHKIYHILYILPTFFYICVFRKGETHLKLSGLICFQIAAARFKVTNCEGLVDFSCKRQKTHFDILWRNVTPQNCREGLHTLAPRLTCVLDKIIILHLSLDQRLNCGGSQ